MSDPTRKGHTLGRAFRVSLRIVGGFLFGWLGWLAWVNASIEWWPLWPFGVVFMVTGGAQLIGSTFEALGMMLGHTRWRRYRRLGGKPKADSMARDREIAEYGRLP